VLDIFLRAVLLCSAAVPVSSASSHPRAFGNPGAVLIDLRTMKVFYQQVGRKIENVHDMISAFK